MLDLEVVPERSIGTDKWEFILGMPFSQCVSILQSQDSVVKRAQVCYSEQQPLDEDLVIKMPHDGINLIFDPRNQRLKIIEVYNVSKIKLKYCGAYFSAPEVPPTIGQIHQSFGATLPGGFDAEKQIYLLSFRGITFAFPTVPGLQAKYNDGIGKLQFPNGSSPLLGKLCVYTGTALADTEAPLLPLSAFHGNCYLDSLEVVRAGGHTKRLRLKLQMESYNPERCSEKKRLLTDCDLLFGMTCQDLSKLLGSPSKVFYKSEDKMRIHSADANKTISRHCSDYFYNYFTLGLDVLFDGVLHTAKKFVLHTNIPGHYDFNIYHRCEFRISLDYDSRGPADDVLRKSDGCGHVTPATKWTDIEGYADKKKPVVFHRTSSVNSTNPFGETLYYGIQDLIFEVMANKHIASVTLCSSSSLGRN